MERCAACRIRARSNAWVHSAGRCQPDQSWRSPFRHEPVALPGRASKRPPSVPIQSAASALSDASPSDRAMCAECCFENSETNSRRGCRSCQIASTALATSTSPFAASACAHAAPSTCDAAHASSIAWLAPWPRAGYIAPAASPRRRTRPPNFAMDDGGGANASDGSAVTPEARAEASTACGSNGRKMRSRSACLARTCRGHRAETRRPPE